MKPKIGISMGDPAGIGPEICVKALGESSVYERCNPIVVGDAQVMQQAVAFLKSELKINAVENVSEAKFESGTIDVLDLKNGEMSVLDPGVVSALSGNHALGPVHKVIELVMAK